MWKVIINKCLEGCEKYSLTCAYAGWMIFAYKRFIFMDVYWFAEKILSQLWIKMMNRFTKDFVDIFDSRN